MPTAMYIAPAAPVVVAATIDSIAGSTLTNIALQVGMVILAGILARTAKVRFFPG